MATTTKFFFLETQILFPSLNLNHITHSPSPWAPHLPWKQSMCYLFFSLLGFFLSLKVLMEWETPCPSGHAGGGQTVSPGRMVCGVYGPASQKGTSP